MCITSYELQYDQPEFFLFFFIIFLVKSAGEAQRAHKFNGAETAFLTTAYRITQGIPFVMYSHITICRLSAMLLYATPRRHICISEPPSQCTFLLLLLHKIAES